MNKLIVVDVGGTTIKYGLWDQNEKELSNKASVTTPDTLANFYGTLKFITDEFSDEKIEGISLSIPGAVDQTNGIIGGISALPYIHNFPIQAEIAEKLQMKVAMENDANCAALAELSVGVAKDMQNILFLVIGTGIGGAVVCNRQIIRGTHLYGGEFGMMLGEHKDQLSLVGTAVHLADRYNAKYGTEFSGKQILELAETGDKNAMFETEIMYSSLAQTIYNLQFVVDPEAIVIGGAVSTNPSFINYVNLAVKSLMDSLGDIPIVPTVIAAKYHNDANLIGAAYNFYN